LPSDLEVQKYTKQIRLMRIKQKIGYEALKRNKSIFEHFLSSICDVLRLYTDIVVHPELEKSDNDISTIFKT
jgi:hypothetical protein